MHYTELLRTIKKRRDDMQVNQETLAELSGVGLRTLKQFESGKGNPTLLTLQKLADALGLEICIKIKEVQILRQGAFEMKKRFYSQNDSTLEVSKK